MTYLSLEIKWEVRQEATLILSASYSHYVLEKVSLFMKLPVNSQGLDSNPLDSLRTQKSKLAHLLWTMWRDGWNYDSINKMEEKFPSKWIWKVSIETSKFMGTYVPSAVQSYTMAKGVSPASPADGVNVDKWVMSRTEVNGENGKPITYN